ncbi:hypothetical protein [Halorarius litoreus]|uniref:hypothetical protein n=1 Tax=Halorarius litoreus TaxID=2962676 RepID=UPI0020CF41E7|nr:hypothetical protein [Halorarius litoreus]
MDRENYAALLVLAGLVLLANGAWAYPNEVSYDYTVTYEAEQTDLVPDDEWGRTAAGLDYKDCERSTTRLCVFSTYVADEGPVRVDSEAEPPLYGHDYLTLSDNRHYRTVERVENGSLVVDLEPVDRERLRRLLAVNYSETHGVVRSALDNGTATRTVPLDDREYLPERTYVDRNGTVYEVAVVESHREPTGWGWKAPSEQVVDVIRLSGWLGGVALLVRAGQVSVESCAAP